MGKFPYYALLLFLLCLITLLHLWHLVSAHISIRILILVTRLLCCCFIISRLTDTAFRPFYVVLAFFYILITFQKSQKYFKLLSS